MSIAKFGKKCGKELGKTLAICAVLAAAFLTVSASAESKARIVRLSEVEGTVQLDRATGAYKEINLRALRLLPPGGILVTCSCSHH